MSYETKNIILICDVESVIIHVQVIGVTDCTISQSKAD